MTPKIQSKHGGELVLWLDLWVASVGWSLVSLSAGWAQFIDAGVKIFQEPVEPKSWAPKNQKRRERRWARKTLARKVERKRELKETLERAGLGFTQDHWLDPYELRKIGIESPLNPQEFGIVLYHFAQKRGFLSNRKSGNSDEDGKVASSIVSIRQSMEGKWCRTLGEYRYLLIREREANGLAPQKFQENYTSRSMYLEEFDILWNAQSKNHPEILTDALRYEIKNFIFFQRPLKIQKYLVGDCVYHKNRKRAQKASLIAQEFLVWKTVNDLRYKQVWMHEFLDLPIEKKRSLANLLLTKKSMTFGAMKKELKLWDPIILNLESEKKESLKWSSTYATMMKWNKWHDLNESQQTELVTSILTTESTESLIRLLKTKWGMSEVESNILANPEVFENGYVGYSEKALRQILPLMKETGMNDRETAEVLIKRGELPKERNEYAGTDPWKEAPKTRNPIVTKSVTEARKVLRAIIQAHWEPTTIRIEMASEMKKTKKQKELAQREMNLNKKRNEAAAQFYKEYWIENPSYTQLTRHRLWIESDNRCPYTGKSISAEQLVSENSEIDIEHIIPYSRCLDDGYMNKTLCYADFNRGLKKNRTPWELGQENPEWYGEFIERTKWYPYQKRKRFELKEIDTDDFISRQLNDTRYVAREVKAFSEALIWLDKVEITKWSLTSLLRHAWGYNWLIDESAEEKDRWDHRHHAIDATIVALTSRSMLQHASKLSAHNEDLWKKGDDSYAKVSKTYGEISPWDAFRSTFSERLKEMHISHTASHKIRGALHEETGYGKIIDPTTGEETYVVRKKLDESWGEKWLEKVVDSTVRGILHKYFSENEKFSRSNPPLHKDGKTPILSVRVKETKSGMYNYRNEGNLFYAFGSNHHVEILEHKTKKNTDGTPKRIGAFITTWEANDRAKKKTSVVNRTGPWIREKTGESLETDEWNFVCSLCANDMFKTVDGGLYCVTGMSGPKDYIALRKHTNASGSWYDLNRSPNTLRWFKMHSDNLGHLFPSND